jgi:hypothetical protein
MRDLTVLVPTAARPELLEMTLRSVAAQNALSRVARVLVSENLGDERSRAVCAAHPELPIDYRLQDPQVSPMRHARFLFDLVDSPYVALVNDDDLWLPGHISTALSALEDAPDAVAHFDAYVMAASELSANVRVGPSPLAIWIAAGRPDRLRAYRLQLRTVLSLCWLWTPFTWSSLVARREPLQEAGKVLTDESYTDRLLFVELAMQGDCLYSPLLNTIYREHEGNWAKSKRAAHLREVETTAAAIVKSRAAELGWDVGAFWRDTLASLPEPDAGELAAVLGSVLPRAELEAAGIWPTLPASTRPTILNRATRRLDRTWDALRGR